MGFGGNTWESLPITTAEVEAALPASVASSSPTGTRVRSVGIDPTVAPYNVDPEGKTDAWEGLATAWEDAQSWTQTEVSGTPGKLTALAGDGTLRAGAALGV